MGRPGESAEGAVRGKDAIEADLVGGEPELGLEADSGGGGLGDGFGLGGHLRG